MRNIKIIQSSINFLGKAIDKINAEDESSLDELLELIHRLQFEKRELELWKAEQTKLCLRKK